VFLNIYSLLAGGHETAQSGASIFGVEVALVTNVNDPDKIGRVKVCVPRLPGKPESGWVRVAQPAAGAGRGFYWLPHVNDEVLIAFERGDPNHPFIIGSLWNGKDKPMKNAFDKDNHSQMIQTKSGHQITLYDKNGEEKIVIADKSGKRTVTFDVKNKKFLIEAKEGNVEINAQKKIILQCEDLEIKTKKTGKLDIGSTFDLKVTDKAGFKAGPQLNIKASKVRLNPSSLTAASLVNAAIAAAQRAAAAAAGAAAAQQKQAAAAAAAAPGAAAGAARGSIVPTKDVAKAGAAGATTQNKYQNGVWLTDAEGKYKFEKLGKGALQIEVVQPGVKLKPAAAPPKGAVESGRRSQAPKAPAGSGPDWSRFSRDPKEE
jgi:phage baseplate assembly protein gpV